MGTLVAHEASDADTALRLLQTLDWSSAVASVLGLPGFTGA